MKQNNNPVRQISILLIRHILYNIGGFVIAYISWFRGYRFGLTFINFILGYFVAWFLYSIIVERINKLY